MNPFPHLSKELIIGNAALAICRTLEPARAVFAAAVAEKPTGRFMILNRIRVVRRYPEGDW
jgi:hypothetical protein